MIRARALYSCTSHHPFNFLQTAENELKMLQRGLKELEATRLQLADFFCEDPQQFKIEECFKIFYQFCDRFRFAVKGE
jgi:hypothetical protein